MKKRYKILLIVLALLAAVGFGRFAYRKWAPDYRKIDYVFKGYTETDGYVIEGLGERFWYYYYSYPEDISSDIAASGLYERVTAESAETIEKALNEGQIWYNNWHGTPKNAAYPRPNITAISEDDFYIFKSEPNPLYEKTGTGTPYENFHLVYYSAADRCIYDVLVEY